MFKLVARESFHDRKTGRAVEKGDVITDQAEVARHSRERERHMIRVAMTPEEIAALTPPPAAPATA